MSIEVSKLLEVVPNTMDSMNELELIVLALNIHDHIEYSSDYE